MDVVTLIGLAAATGTTLAFVPQAIKVIRTKHTKDLSLPMYILTTVGVLLWLIYGILLVNLPIIVANSITVVFSGIILWMKVRYK